MFCENCGKKLSDKDVFCSECGATVGNKSGFIGNRVMTNTNYKTSYGIGTSLLRKIYIIAGLVIMIALFFTGTVAFSSSTSLGKMYAQYKGNRLGFEASALKIFMNMVEDANGFSEILGDEPVVGISLIVIVGSMVLMLVGYLTSLARIKDAKAFLSRTKLFFVSATVFFVADVVLVYSLNEMAGYGILECGKPILACGIIAIVMLVLFKPMYANAHNRESVDC